MRDQTAHPPSWAAIWALANRQHGVVSRNQLIEAGLGHKAIKYRIARRRLHCLLRGVYAVGRPEVSQEGWWMAAVLACGARAVISHDDALALWGIRPRKRRPAIHVSTPESTRIRRPGLIVHRRSSLGARDVSRRRGIPVTTPAVTIVDIAANESERRLERAINEADQNGVLPFDGFRSEIDRMTARPGLAVVKRLIEPYKFRLTRSELERLFLPIARRAGLPVPQTRAIVNGFEVDFWWPGLGLVVETDSLTYHRTPAKQLQDRRRDQTHMTAGLIPLRFTHWQIAREARDVERILGEVVQAIRARRAPTIAA